MTDQNAAEGRPAIGGNSALFFGAAIIGAAVDLWTKHAVFAWRGEPGRNPVWWLCENFVGIETAVNEGALFGMGQGRVGLFAVISLFAVVGLVVWFFGGGAVRDRWMSFILGCILGGILGNLYDRLGLWGFAGVRDWILFCYTEAHKWPNFNIADSLLVCGVALLMWRAYMAPPVPAENATDHSSGARPSGADGRS
ncbi:MAG: signal peptidase II [Pirellulaceae bacterium]|nr:signal peptidase II [Planctomycetales bacterium]